jgi:hypothetical protein
VNVNPEGSVPPPPGEAKAEDSQRWSNWGSGSILLLVVILYPLSIMPAYVTMLVLRRRGIDLSVAYDVFYWPVLWVLENVPLFRHINDLIEPVLRGFVK